MNLIHVCHLENIIKIFSEIVCKKNFLLETVKKLQVHQMKVGFYLRFMTCFDAIS